MSSSPKQDCLHDSTSDEGWTKVRSKKERSKQQPKTRVHNYYWNGFDKNGFERWFIELTDGRILTPLDSEYNFWQNRCYMYRN